MKKMVLGITILISLLFVVPTKAESSKIVYEYHDADELGEYGDETKITLASDKTNVLVKLKETNKVYEKDFNTREEYIAKKKEKLKESNEGHLKKMSLPYDDIYISKYSPYIEFSFKASSKTKLKNALSRLEKYDFVEKVYVQDDYKPAIKTGVAKQDMNAYEYIRNDTNKGNGINVGLLEWGIVDVSNENLTNSNITVRDVWYYIETKSEHATLMAALICGQYGIAKNCNLYSVELSGNPVNELDWLIDQDITVCNVSIGDGTGSYSSSSQYIDYISFEYGVTFCCAVGNDGEDAYVSNMALAYNCIAVGSGDDCYAYGYNSMLTPNGQVRPMILAPGSVTYGGFSSNGHTGTSISTALTTGVVVLLQRHYTGYRYQPNRMRALLLANATEYSCASYNSSTGMEINSGAGLINLQKTIDNYNNIVVDNNGSDLGASGFFTTITVPFTSGQRYRFAFSHATRIINDTVVKNNYMMQIYNTSTGLYEKLTNTTCDGIEFCTGDVTGDYNIICKIVHLNSMQFSGYDTLFIAYSTA